MPEPKEILSESKTAEAANAAAVLHEAVSRERESQMEMVFDRSFRRAFTLDDGVTRRFVDISRANLICQAIVAIDGRLERTDEAISSINANISRGVWIVLTAVILALLKLIILP